MPKSVTVAFTGDTHYHPPIAEFVKGTSLLIHEEERNIAVVPEEVRVAMKLEEALSRLGVMDSKARGRRRGIQIFVVDLDRTP